MLTQEQKIEIIKYILGVSSESIMEDVECIWENNDIETDVEEVRDEIEDLKTDVYALAVNYFINS